MIWVAVVIALALAGVITALVSRHLMPPLCRCCHAELDPACLYEVDGLGSYCRSCWLEQT